MLPNNNLWILQMITWMLQMLVSIFLTGTEGVRTEDVCTGCKAKNEAMWLWFFLFFFFWKTKTLVLPVSVTTCLICVAFFFSFNLNTRQRERKREREWERDIEREWLHGKLNTEPSHSSTCCCCCCWSHGSLYSLYSGKIFFFFPSSAGKQSNCLCWGVGRT